MKPNKKTADLIIYAAVVVFAVVFLYAGNIIASGDWEGFGSFHDDEWQFRTAEARVTAILHVEETWDTEWMVNIQRTFEASIVRSAYSGEVGATVVAVQNIANYFGVQPNEIAEGDRVVLIFFPPMFPGDEAESEGEGEGEWYFLEHVRINAIGVLGAAFVILLVIFGRAKGFNAVLSLGFTCSAIFAVFIPSLLSGGNIYVSALIVCAYSVVVTLFMLNGVNQKSLAAAAGCLGGIFAAALLTLLMGGALRLTGMANRELESLLFLPVENPIDLHAVLFAGIIIGAVGAVIDVAVSIASALWELRAASPGLPFSGFLKSGINIGRDIMGSMTNTLVLAYIGSSLPAILILIVSSDSLTDLFNNELVIVELLKAIIGAMGILFALPLTALTCAAMYSRGGTDKTGGGGESEPSGQGADEYEDYIAELGRSLNQE